MKPYVDTSGQEFSINCLQKEDLELLSEGIIMLFATLNRDEKNKAAKRRLIHLKNILENEQ